MVSLASTFASHGVSDETGDGIIADTFKLDIYVSVEVDFGTKETANALFLLGLLPRGGVTQDSSRPKGLVRDIARTEKSDFVVSC